jgi:SAM-dependent methyltransferase
MTRHRSTVPRRSWRTRLEGEELSPACRFCGSARVRRAFAVGDRNRRRSKEVFTYVRCRDCDSLSLPEPPANLGHYYGGDYFALVPADELIRSVKGERWRFDEFVDGFVGGAGHAIEVGPGIGQFAYLLKRNGFTVTAVEQDHAVCEYLREVVGIDVVESPDPARAVAGLPPANVIALWHVLEHLPAPAALLDVLAERLAPGGILIVAIPNTDSLGHRLLGRYWAHVDAPRHLTLPPPNTLVSRLLEAGLTIEAARTDDPGARLYNAFSWDRAMRPLRLPGRLHRLATRAVTRLLASQEARRGSSFTVVARRPERRDASQPRRD